MQLRVDRARGRGLSVAELGAAFGAARLGRLAATGEAPGDVCTPGAVREAVEPDAALGRGRFEDGPGSGARRRA